MDLLRSAIKSVMYDFPLEAVADYIVSGKFREEDPFYDVLNELMAWREKGFSITEISLLEDILKDEWMVDETNGFGKTSLYHPFERIFVLLEQCASKLLETANGMPRVMIQQLLRWRELSLLTGEDTLVIPMLAKADVENEVDRNTFLWPNTLNHNDVQLNDLLNDTLSDTHFHLNAGCDVFEFNWIIMMNHPEVLKGDLPDFMDMGSRRSYDQVRRFTPYNLALKDWIKVAAFLRVGLMELLQDERVGQDFLNPEKLFEQSELDNRIAVTCGYIDNLRRDTLKTSNGIFFDYAISKQSIDGISEEDMSNVYMAHHGERWLLYNYLKKYFGKKDEKLIRLAPFVYLYLLIKNKIRRELIQSNDLRGFQNFQIYQTYKQRFFKFTGDLDAMKEIAFRYAIQTAVGSKGRYNIEARVAPGEIKSYQGYRYDKPIFGERELPKAEGEVTLLAHFIKRQEKAPSELGKSLRMKAYREKLKEELNRILEAWASNSSSTADPKFVGIDAAGSELKCRPEIFAPVFREARRKGLSNFTYHVGEDFYDIVGGLRAIDEAVTFLGLSTGCRIGHAIALGTDAANYYCRRHRYIIIPKQELLDNVVWMKYKAMELNVALNPRTLLFISKVFSRVSVELGYEPGVSEAHYWQSMKRRGEDPLSQAGNVPPQEEEADKLLQFYWYSEPARKKGMATMTERLPEEFVEDVVKIQDGMYREIEDLGLFIETNPTSNLKIGGFEKYSDLPIFKFHSVGDVGRKLPVTINTDDKGVFATSLQNEYSLIAVALRKERDADGKRRWTDRQIMDYLKQIAAYGNMSRFSTALNW